MWQLVFWNEKYTADTSYFKMKVYVLTWQTYTNLAWVPLALTTASCQKKTKTNKHTINMARCDKSKAHYAKSDIQCPNWNAQAREKIWAEE
jgi:hypothetical protein